MPEGGWLLSDKKITCYSMI